MRRTAKIILLVIALAGVWSLINYYRTTTREEVLYSFTIPDRYMRVDEWPKESTEHAIEKAPFCSKLFDGTNGKNWMIAGWDYWDLNSPPGERYALINGKQVVCDNYRIPHYQGDKHMVFAIRSKNKSLIFLDGKHVRTIKPEVRRIALSDGERSILCSTFQGNLKITGNKITPYQGLVDTDERFRLRTVKRGNQTSLLLDDKEIDSAAGIAYPQINPDGKRVAYWRSWDNKNWQLVADGKPLPGMVCETRMDDNGKPRPYGYFIFGPDGKRIACTLQKHQMGYLFVDGKEVDSAVGIDNLQLSPDGNRVAYWRSTDGEKWQLIMDGKPQQGMVCDNSIYSKQEHSYPGGRVEFSPNSRRFLCMLSRNKISYLYSEKGLLHNALYFPECEFSPDSKRIAYTWCNSSGKLDYKSPLHTVVDGKELFNGGSAYFWTFSPDSKKYAVSKLGKFGNQLYVNNKPIGPRSKDVDIYRAGYFSPDSRHLIYYIQDKGSSFNIVQMVFDGKWIIPRHDELLTYPTLHKDSITYWVADYANGRVSINSDTTIDSGTTIKFVRVKLKK